VDVAEAAPLEAEEAAVPVALPVADEEAELEVALPPEV
jgi:hypothetical protein